MSYEDDSAVAKWNTDELGDESRKAKFLRLMGAGKFVKQTAEEKPKLEGGIKEGNPEAKNPTAGSIKYDEVNAKLEQEFRNSLDYRLSGGAYAHTGLGFSSYVAPRASGSVGVPSFVRSEDNSTAENKEYDILDAPMLHERHRHRSRSPIKQEDDDERRHRKKHRHRSPHGDEEDGGGESSRHKKHRHSSDEDSERRHHKKHKKHRRVSNEDSDIKEREKDKPEAAEAKDVDSSKEDTPPPTAAINIDSQWDGVNLGSQDRNEKFLRLLGGRSQKSGSALNRGGRGGLRNAPRPAGPPPRPGEVSSDGVSVSGHAVRYNTGAAGASSSSAAASAHTAAQDYKARHQAYQSRPGYR